MDSTEFAALIRRHAGLIHKIAYAYCRHATDREDLVQEIAVQLWRSRDRYDDRFRHTTWIYRIALNVAISFFRRERRHRERQLPIDDHAIVIEPVEPSAELRWLMRCIDELGALDRALVVLYLEGNDHAAIAEVLGISASNVGTKIARIKTRLRAAFEDHARGQREQEQESHGAR
jgi:RNA polymerase sigma-70 factor (ECF subfamily)